MSMTRRGFLLTSTAMGVTLPMVWRFGREGGTAEIVDSLRIRPAAVFLSNGDGSWTQVCALKSVDLPPTLGLHVKAEIDEVAGAAPLEPPSPGLDTPGQAAGGADNPADVSQT